MCSAECWSFHFPSHYCHSVCFHCCLDGPFFFLSWRKINTVEQEEMRNAMTAASKIPFPSIWTPQSCTHHNEFISSSTAAKSSRTCPGFLRLHFSVAPFLLHSHFPHRAMTMSSQLRPKPLRPKPLILLGQIPSSLQAIPVCWGTTQFPFKVEDNHAGTEKVPSQNSLVSHLIKVSFPRRIGYASK